MIAPPTTSARPACCASPSRAGSTSSREQTSPVSLRSPLQATATSSTVRTACGSVLTRRANDAVSAAESGGGTSGPVCSRASGFSASSVMASGLPPVRSWIRVSQSSGTGVGVSEPTRLRAAPRSSPASARCSRPSTRSSASPARAARSTATGSELSRRAANTRAVADGRSSRCTSSITTATGASSAYRQSRLRVPAPTVNRSPGDPGRSASAPARASACGGAIVSRRPRAGRSTPSSPANGTSRSGSVPVARSTRNPSSRPSAQRSRAVFPTPASPVSASTPLAPILAPATSRSMVCCSRSRPMSTYRA